MLLMGVDFFTTLLEYMSNSLYPAQVHHSARPDLDPNCFQNQQTAKVVTSKERVGEESIFEKKNENSNCSHLYCRCADWHQCYKPFIMHAQFN